MRTVFQLIAIASAGLALAGCTGERLSGPSSTGSSASNYAYEPPGSIARAPLSAPPGYGSQPGYGSGYGSQQGYGSPPPLGAPSAHGNSQGYGSQGYGAADTAAPGGWQASPRWSAVQGDGCIEVEQGGQAARGGVRVEPCTNRVPEEIGEGTPAGLPPPATY
jgi:hypothetical protein